MIQPYLCQIALIRHTYYPILPPVTHITHNTCHIPTPGPAVTQDTQCGATCCSVHSVHITGSASWLQLHNISTDHISRLVASAAPSATGAGLNQSAALVLEQL